MDNTVTNDNIVLINAQPVEMNNSNNEPKKEKKKKQEKIFKQKKANTTGKLMTIITFSLLSVMLLGFTIWVFLGIPTWAGGAGLYAVPDFLNANALAFNVICALSFALLWAFLIIIIITTYFYFSATFANDKLLAKRKLYLAKKQIIDEQNKKNNINPNPQVIVINNQQPNNNHQIDVQVIQPNKTYNTQQINPISR